MVDLLFPLVWNFFGCCNYAGENFEKPILDDKVFMHSVLLNTNIKSVCTYVFELLENVVNPCDTLRSRSWLQRDDWVYVRQKDMLPKLLELTKKLLNQCLFHLKKEENFCF